jgi:hypothetical protein
MVNRATALDPGAVKPGWTTTEFYQALLVNVIGAIVAIVTLFKTNFSLNGAQAAVPAVALAAATVAQAVYTLSRAKVKAAAQDASARVQSARLPPRSTEDPATTVTAGSSASAAEEVPQAADVPQASGPTAIPAPTILTVHFDDLRSCFMTTTDQTETGAT